MAYHKLTLSAMGDSQTDWTMVMGVPGELTYPELTANRLRAVGVDIKSRNFGTSGNTTPQCLARFDVMGMYDTPDIGIIYAGVNDPFNSISQASTQANIQAMIKALKFSAYGAPGMDLGSTVASQTNLPAYGALGQRYVVLTDTSTAGGLLATHPSHHATITGAGASAQTVWEYRNQQAGEAGWGRVATVATTAWGTQMIVVITNNYLNWTTGGDSYNTATSTGTQYSSYVQVRAACQAAVTAEANNNNNGYPSVVLADIYAYQSQLIYGANPTDTQGSNSWHAITNNQHHNGYGHDIVSRCVFASLPASWLKVLTFNN